MTSKDLPAGFTAQQIDELQNARCADAHAVLGFHGAWLRVFRPDAERIQWCPSNSAAPIELNRVLNTDVFWCDVPARAPDRPAVLDLWCKDGRRLQINDPFGFAAQIGELDLHLLAEGQHRQLWNLLGAQPQERQGIAGVRFAVWAPNALRVSVVGSFNSWDGRIHPMQRRGESGVFELFLPGVESGERYQFELLSRLGGAPFLKSDPFARWSDEAPQIASRVVTSTYRWDDATWRQSPHHDRWQNRPLSIYEVHLPSWRRHADGRSYTYRELAKPLAEYLVDLGFTHVEFLPLAEHPFLGSWGYQSTGYFSPTSRLGRPDDLRFLIDVLHQQGIGVILDWVPGHFPNDAHGLARFDGSALFEHLDPRQGFHPDWSTFIFNFGRKEVANFLIANALYWLKEFHFDGLRVDAVASMLYLDYSRNAGEWIPNQFGGRENLDAIDFIKHLNRVVGEECPQALMIAEESTSWPQVTRPPWVGGLGFRMKWNMGWMHDSLSYLGRDPVYRPYHHDLLTFGLMYAFTENFLLPLSHDEVVHGKGSLINKMWGGGDNWRQFAQLRLLLLYQFTYPGKKLLFMGGEFAQRREWNHDAQLDWFHLEQPQHRGIHTLVRDLNALYCRYAELHGAEFEAAGFEWIDCHDRDQSVISYLRRYKGRELMVVLNFTPELRYRYGVGVSVPGTYVELINSDSSHYGGSNSGNIGMVRSSPVPLHGRSHCLHLTLPPLGGLVLQWTAKEPDKSTLLLESDP